MRKYTNALLAVLAAVIILVGVFLRIAGLGFISMDMRTFVIRWYDQLAIHGFLAMQSGFSNYTPPYLYLLWIATWTRSLIPEIMAIKLISILFDVGCAAWVFKIVRIKYPEGPIPALGAAVFFVLPTIFLDSAWWGQADSVYTFFVLVSFYFLLRDHPLPAMIFFGISASFKLQAVFFVPFLLLLTLKRRIPWTYFMIVPLVYIMMMIPAVMVGRPILDTLTIYLSQADTYQRLSMNAPNLYQLVSNTWYEPLLIIGLGGTALLALAWAIGYSRKIDTWTPDRMVMCAAVSSLMMPFFLPKMHERYFFIADVMLLLLVIYLPRLWVVLLASQIVSTITYSIYLFLPNASIAALMSPAVPLLLLATLINTLLIGSLFGEQYLFIKSTP